MERTRIPLAVVSHDSQVIYFPWQIGTFAWNTKLPDHLRIISNAVASKSWGLPTSYESGSGKVLYSVWKGPGYWLIWLINQAADRPAIETIPLYDTYLHVVSDISEGKPIDAVALDGTAIAVQVLDNGWRVIVPRWRLIHSCKSSRKVVDRT